MVGKMWPQSPRPATNATRKESERAYITVHKRRHPLTIVVVVLVKFCHTMKGVVQNKNPSEKSILVASFLLVPFGLLTNESTRLPVDTPQKLGIDFDP